VQFSVTVVHDKRLSINLDVRQSRCSQLTHKTEPSYTVGTPTTTDWFEVLGTINKMKLNNLLIISKVSQTFNFGLIKAFVELVARQVSSQNDAVSIASIALIPLLAKLSFHSNINRSLISSVGAAQLYTVYVNLLDLGRDSNINGQMRVTDVLSLSSAQVLINSYPNNIVELIPWLDGKLAEQAQLEFTLQKSSLLNASSIESLSSAMLRLFNLVRLSSEHTKATVSGLSSARSNLSLHAYRLVSDNLVATSSHTPDAGLAAMAYMLGITQHTEVPGATVPLSLGLGASDTVYYFTDTNSDAVALHIHSMLTQRTAKVVSIRTNSSLTAKQLPMVQKRSYSNSTVQAAEPGRSSVPVFEVRRGDLSLVFFTFPNPSDWPQILESINKLRLRPGRKVRALPGRVLDNVQAR
jgi:hypothetical protein